MHNPISGPGVLFVRSRISPASHPLLSESTYLTWYDTEHIPDVLSSRDINNAFRYIDVSKTSPIGDSRNPTPFLVCYPMPDLAFTKSEKFRGISVESEKLPGSGLIYDLANFEVSYLGFRGATQRKRDGRAKFIVTAGIRPEGEPEEEKVMEFFEKQTAMISKEPHYIRTLRFKLVYARTNAQSRALKGLPATDEPQPEPSTWVAIHEFAELPEESLLERIKSDAETTLNESANDEGWGKTESEVHVWKVDSVQGEGKFFDD
ncbi:hypothetical protein COCCADRAFT_103486 [Bipolaris zeicola 26-R-13]|uniref:Uncharacterized protein n=1 Tax=Cochliobolus carbonum (strain 26-R-13) TaxID=930089 RepID=W6XZ68_COCC2|nr:uncharacterized protein COCCADRAFT_103486 [Bipolaris zeicola 26-R-13]EUC30605.1 hypothetical protein COCCADRAFT_103486 [Bipolaris zeicola 26-R-13]